MTAAHPNPPAAARGRGAGNAERGRHVAGRARARWFSCGSAGAARELLAERLERLVGGQRAAVALALLGVATAGVGRGLAGLDLGLGGLLLLLDVRLPA